MSKKSLAAEIRREMAALTNAHILADSEEHGVIYWDFNYESFQFESGGACNSGLIPDFSFDYDAGESFQSNLENFYAAAMEHYGIDA